MRLNRIAESSQALSAHTSLFCFTLLLLLKLHHLVSYSWRIIFIPLFVFHVVVARRSSTSEQSVSYGLYVAPNRVPWLIAFELLLLAYLWGAYVSLTIVFLPLLAFEVAIFVDNFRMCKALLQEVGDAIWLALPHFWVAISMVFFVVGTVFTLRKLNGDTNSLSWWNLFLYFGIAECFAFLVCTKWCNPVIHRYSQIHIRSSSSTAIRYLDWNSGIVGSTEDISENCVCGLQDTVGYVVNILFIVFQILLCMRLEGKPAAARYIPLPVVFSPIFLVQGLGVLFAAFDLVEKFGIILPTGIGTRMYFAFATRARDSFRFFQRGFRWLGRWSTEVLRRWSTKVCRWWSTKVRRWRSTEEASRDEQARKYHDGSSGYNTFSSDSKKDLTEEDDNLCTICFDGKKNMVLLPCMHDNLCSVCSEKCEKCPICRVVIKERLSVYDA